MFPYSSPAHSFFGRHSSPNLGTGVLCVDYANSSVEEQTRSMKETVRQHRLDEEHNFDDVLWRFQYAIATVVDHLRPDGSLPRYMEAVKASLEERLPLLRCRPDSTVVARACHAPLSISWIETELLELIRAERAELEPDPLICPLHYNHQGFMTAFEVARHVDNGNFRDHRLVIINYFWPIFFPHLPYDTYVGGFRQLTEVERLRMKTSLL